MDFELSEEQLALQELVRDFLREQWPSDRMRAALDEGPALIDEETWQEIVEMGWLGVSAPEEAGGIGEGVLGGAVISAEAGRGLLPGPLLSSLAAGIALDRGACQDVLTDLVAGRTRVTPAVEEPGGAWGPDAVSVEAVPADGGWSLSGVKILVPDAEAADLLLVAARTPSGLGFVRVPSDAEGVTITPMRRLDAQAIAEVRFDNVRIGTDALLGGEGRSEQVLREAYDAWTVLTAADLLGSAEAALEMTTKYAGERIQFGRPIGSFQAVSHRLADGLVDVEIGRSLLYAACLAIDEGRDDAPALVSAAKSWAGDTAVSVAESALQIHGGVGFTWEEDVHLYLRRARANAATLGDADFHRDRVALHLDTEYAAEA